MAKSFVRSFKRDYVYINDCHSADEVMAKLPAWIVDYNTIDEPGASPGMRRHLRQRHRGDQPKV